MAAERWRLHPDFGTVYMGAPIGIPFIVVSGSQPLVPIDFMFYASESDPGPYPYPPNAPIEGVTPGATLPIAGVGDQHVLVVDKDHMKLYETWSRLPPGRRTQLGDRRELERGERRGLGPHEALHGPAPARLDVGRRGRASDLPGLARYDETVTAGVINHALRFTVNARRRASLLPRTTTSARARTRASRPWGAPPHEGRHRDHRRLRPRSR